MGLESLMAFILFSGLMTLTEVIFLPRESRTEGLKDSKGLKAVEVSSLISVDADPILQRGKDNKKGEKERESRRKNRWDSNTAKGCTMKFSCVCPE